MRNTRGRMMPAASPDLLGNLNDLRAHGQATPGKRRPLEELGLDGARHRRSGRFQQDRRIDFPRPPRGDPRREGPDHQDDEHWDDEGLNGRVEDTATASAGSYQ